MEKKYSFAALLAVIGISIVFGMVLGGRLNAPQGMLAAREGIVLAQNPLVTSGVAPADFADLAEAAIPAVVSVVNTSVAQSRDGERGAPDDPFFYWFFGRPDQDQPRRSQPETSFGSGFLISKDGYILTNNHVVEGATKLRVDTKSGDRYEAKVIGTDPAIDMALIKIDPRGKDLPSLPLGDSERLRVGEWVVAIGNPLNLDNTVTVGVVSAKERRVPIGGTDGGVATFIQTDAAINRGNSGGPLLDSRGRVVGMNTAILRGAFPGQGVAEGIGFALPIRDARASMEQILATGEVRRGFLGISMNTDPLNESAREFFRLPDTSGVVVQSVTPGEAADKAGIQPDDVIRKVDGEEVKNNLDLVGRIANRRPGDTVTLEVWRDGKPRSVEVSLGARDADKIAGRGRNNREPGRTPRDDSGEPDEAEAIGIKVRDLTPSMRRQLGNVQGVFVEEVEITAEASDEGVQHGSVITQVNRTPIRTVEDFREAFAKLKPGDPVRLVLRDGELDRSVFLTMPRR
jgi:serine protease Do